MNFVDVELILIGLVVGVLVGLTGVGGGSIMTPMLVQVLKVNPLVAVGTDLLYSVPTRLYGAFLHRQQGTVNGHIVRALLWGGMPASLASLALLFWLRHHIDVVIVEMWTRRAIGVTLFVAAGMILAQPFFKRHRLETIGGEFTWRPGQRARVIALGALVGCIVTLTSIGSGAVTLPLLTLALPLVGLPELIGSDIAFAAFLIPAAALGRWSMGDVNPALALWLLIGSLPGVYIGSKLCTRLHARWLRPAVAVTLIFVGSRLM
ncbi:MAG TPA: sulfite exporter TauE/SafE family protein [Candidatus Tumulicola sp.]|nr:sulfite exporter TauE/SafE family protein [Candidatus Tumulicola sp.]